MKYKKIKFQILALILCLSMILVGMPVVVVAEEATAATEEALTEGMLTEESGESVEVIEDDALAALKRLEPGDVPLELLSSMPVLTEENLPEFIRVDAAEEKLHVNRVEEQETNLSTVIFQNQDGTKTSYIFGSPVKYFAPDGSVRDKSTALTAGVGGYAYAMVDNSVRVGFPSVMSTGVRLQYADYQLDLVPEGDESVTAVYSESENGVIYMGAFGLGTALTYRPTLSGMKEDIVLLKKGTGNVFSFVMTLDEWVPVLENGRWVLKNTDGEVVGRFGAISISDSAGNTAKGSMSVTAAGDGQYTVTVTAPADFLADDTTVYPVYVDPTVTIEETSSYYDEDGNLTSLETIQDVSIFRMLALADDAIANPDWHYLGNFVEGGRVIYRFYDFYDDSGAFRFLGDANIISANFSVSALSGLETTLYATTMSSTWDTLSYGADPIAILDGNLWDAGSGMYISSTVAGTASGSYEIDITDIAKAWARYNDNASTNVYDNPEYGLMLYTEDNDSRMIYSTEAEGALTCLTVEYSTTIGRFVLNHAYTGKFITAERIITRAPVDLSASVYTTSNSLTNCVWCLQYIGNDQYYICTALTLEDWLCCTDSGRLNASTLLDLEDERYIWTFTSVAGGYFIRSVYNNQVLLLENGSFSMSVVGSGSEEFRNLATWRMTEEDSFQPVTSVSVSETEWLGIGDTTTLTYSYAPTNATWATASDFVWSSSNTSVATVSQAGVVTGVGDGEATITATHRVTGVSGCFPVSVGQIVPAGTYCIRNIGSGLYVDLEGPSTAEGANIQQWTYHTGSQAKWLVSYVGSGYYTIKSAYSGKYVAVSNGSQSNGAAIVQTATLSNACHWQIVKTRNGNYRFISRVSGSYERVLSLPSLTTTNGINLQQKTKSTNGSMIDEWKLENNTGERYFYELVETYGFSTSEASLIRSLYDRIDQVYANESDTMKAWRCSRLLGGLVYSQTYSGTFKWNDVAGNAHYGITEESYFTGNLGYTSTQYSNLKSAMNAQYEDSSTSDFPHFQISLAARLAYFLNEDGVFSNIYTLSTDETVSYLAGWLGDATILDETTQLTSFGNDDYCADLDAENVYRRILQGEKYIDAIANYHAGLTTTNNRATIFLNYISYSTVQTKVLDELDKTLSEVQNLYPDTYNFLMSLQDRLANIENYY